MQSRYEIEYRRAAFIPNPLWALVASFVCLPVLVTPLLADDATDRKGLQFFESRIRPVLVAECYGCHSQKAGNPKAGLLVDSRQGLRQGGESGAAVVPGNPDDSLLMEALRHEGVAMPPTKKLSDRVIADFETWIKLGAQDPREQGSGSAPLVLDVAQARQFWSFQPVKPVVAPSVNNRSWPRADLDRFVLAGMESQGLQPVADASRRQLVRRLFFDLIGLPPTPDEIREFEQDQAGTAVERLVDRLLQSPHFGERWGRHWLDVARYAESNGSTDNVTYPHAWRYRDYVIRSLNDDKPYDQFIREQIAGDLLPPAKGRQRDDQLIATGFLALGPKPRAQNNPDFQMDVVAEQIEVTTAGFLALTVGCARCHDHKFDPIPTDEYYALAGIFTSSKTLYSAGGGKGNGKLEKTGFHTLSGDAVASANRQAVQDQLTVVRELQKTTIDALRQMGALPPATGKASGKKAQTTANAKNKNKKADKQPKPGSKKAVATIDVAAAIKDAKVPANAAPRVKDLVQKKIAELKELQEREEQFTASLQQRTGLAMGIREAKEIGDCRICIRGESKDRGPVVPRSFISIATVGESPKFSGQASGRLELANWLSSPQNPLTARVIVNRVWSHLFGQGIVTTVDNFGALGSPPSHPELLDYLALRLVAEKWSLKQLIKQIVLSRTYGLSSEHHASNFARDPDNIYLWRHSPRRLEAEALRDAMLAASGDLERKPPVTSAVSSLGEQVVREGKGNLADSLSSNDRHRSVYLPVLRNAMPEVLDLFDAPDPALLVGARDRTNVPAQSLYLMNSAFVVEQSRQMASRLLAGRDPGDVARLERLFLRVLGRSPTADEQQRFTQFIAQAKLGLPGKRGDSGGGAGESELRAWAATVQAMFELAEFRYVE
ncbi:MAG: PSD1 and planctomycete cytochrome C domain-containing protein [Planctomycetota bacterium]